jgi:PAS domain S-box-containing protein
MANPSASHFDALPCGWLCLNEQGTIVAANAAICRLVGITASELEGRSFDSLLTRPSRVMFQSYLQPLLRLHGNVEELALALQCGDGPPIDVLIYTAKNVHATGLLIDVIVAPIQQRRRIEEEMLRIKRAADHAPGVIFQLMQLADGSLHFPYTSEAIRRLYGVTSEAVRAAAETVLSLIDFEDRTVICSAMRVAASAATDWRGIYRVRKPNGDVRWHEAQATPRYLANGVVLWHGHAADVTQRREMEVALADQQALERLHQVRSEFLARVSHELRTPLNGILGFAELLSTSGSDNLTHLQRDRLEVIRSSGKHLLQLINEVLDVSSLEGGQLKVTLQFLPLRPLIQQALRMVEPLAGAAGVHLQPLHCTRGVTVTGNEQRLQQVMVNLLSNAIKYNRRGGTVRIEVQELAQEVRVSVIDTGKGLSDEQCAQMFQPFNRLGAENSATEGHGLGLVISKHLLELMGASIDVRSALGEGSTFTVRLKPGAENPALPYEAHSESVGVREEESMGISTPTGAVLYVEDNQVNATLMAAIIGLRPGVELHIARDGATAIRDALAQPPRLFLLDMNLPDMDGFELLAALRAHDSLRDVPAVMVSATAGAEHIALARKRGFVGYWTKPLDVDKTLNEIDGWLSGALSR